MKTRRDFILDTCKICFLAATAGIGMSMLESCGSMKSITATDAGENKIKVPLKSFTEHAHILVKRKGSDAVIFAQKDANGNYTALPMICTHKGQPLTAQDTQLYCSAHGSSFDFNGTVTHGPAKSNLKAYPTSVTDQDLVIDLNS